MAKRKTTTLQTKARGGKPPKSTNDAVFQLTLGWIDELKENHGGNPFHAPNLREVDMEGLYRTNFCEFDPMEKGWGYFSAANVKILGTSRPDSIMPGHWFIWSDGTGVFVYRGWGPEDRQLKDGVSNARCMVRFFAFGCKHEWEQSRNLGNCLNEYQCKHCGIVQTVDSSD